MQLQSLKKIAVAVFFLILFVGCTSPAERRGIDFSGVMQSRCTIPPAEQFRASGDESHMVFIDISSMRIPDELQITYQDEILYQCRNASSDPRTGVGDTFRIEVAAGPTELTFTNLTLDLVETIEFEADGQKYLMASIYVENVDAEPEWQLGVFDTHPGYE